VDENLPVSELNRTRSEDSFNVAVADLFFQEALRSEPKFSLFEDLSRESHDRLINETYNGSFTRKALLYIGLFAKWLP
jgi:hypothetical protein